MSSNPVVPAAAPEGRWWPAILGLLVLMGGLFFFRLGDDMALQSHEALLAETSRNMYIDRPAVVDDGSRPSPWLVPNFGDSPRLRKTPLPYWTVACLAHLTGGVDEWTARFPSAVAALGTVLLILLLVRRWTDRPTALLAGLALATSVGFAMIARQALSDMPMTFYSTAALAALWVAVETRGPRRFVWLVVSGAIGGLAMLAKGPAPLLVFWGPSLAAIFLMIAPLVKPRRPGEGGRKEWFWCLAGIVAACVVALAIMLPWPIYVLLQVSEAIEIWRMESVGRSLGEYGHTKGESVFFYLTRLPVLLAPWIIFFVYGVALGVKRLRQVATDRPWLIFLASWLVPTLVSFSLAAGKQDHYILPFLPAAAVLTGMAMRRMLPGDAPAEPQRDRWLLPLHAILSIVMGAGAVIVYAVWRVRPSAFEGIKAVAPFATPEILGPVLVVGLVGIVAGLAAWVLARRRPGLGLTTLAAAFAGVFLIGWCLLFAPTDRSLPAKQYSTDVCRKVPADAPLYAFISPNNAVRFYVARPMPSLLEAKDVNALIASGRPFYLIVTARYMPGLREVRGLTTVINTLDPYRKDEGFLLLQYGGAGK